MDLGIKAHIPFTINAFKKALSFDYRLPSRSYVLFSPFLLATKLDYEICAHKLFLFELFICPLNILLPISFLILIPSISLDIVSDRVFELHCAGALACLAVIAILSFQCYGWWNNLFVFWSWQVAWEQREMNPTRSCYFPRSDTDVGFGFIAINKDCMRKEMSE